MKTLEQIEPRIPISNMPYSITAPGSYYVTTNLTGTASENGITIQANGVTIDLNGFLLTGSGTNSGHGIFQSGTEFHSATVRNGTIANWRSIGNSGIALEGNNNRVENIQSYSNNLAVKTGAGSVIRDCTVYGSSGTIISGGINAGPGSVVSRCTVYGSIVASGTGVGIFASDGSTIDRCTVVSNQFAGNAIGIFGGNGSIVRNCAVYQNTSSGGFSAIGVIDGGEIADSSASANTSESGIGIGISGGEGTIIRNCIAQGNSVDGTIGAGISVGSGGSVIDSTAFDLKGTATELAGIYVPSEATVTGCSAVNNAQDGIWAGSGNLLRANVSNGNGRYGIYVTGTGNTIDGNTLKSNDAGLLVMNTNNVIISNYAMNNTTTNYALAAGNTFGPIVEVPGSGDLATVTNASHRLANFSY